MDQKKNKNIYKILSLAGGALALVGLIFLVLKLTGAGPFAPSDKKYQHTSANGIETWDSGYMRKDLTALELTELMGNGINLGNTMEAYGHRSLGTKADTSAYETLWGQPVTTQEIVSAMKAAGFDSLRIPVAWTNMMDYENDDFTIDEAYLNRVEEIINYALNADMYVIINDHWDGSWWGMFGSATEATREKAMEMYISMWTQIANRYKEYSDYLIFESANEELGDRLNDVDVAADSGTLSREECYEMTNKINQTFVDVVRGTGGNNEQRFLLIAGYGTDIQNTCDDAFKMPADTAKSKLLISVHYYVPWGYCGNTSLSQWGTQRNYQEQNSLLEKMTKFTEQGYGVIIGEYAVSLADDGSAKANTCDFFTNFLDNCDLYGYCPMLWDCSSLFIRRDLGFFDQEVADLFASRSYAAQAASGKTAEELRAEAQSRIETSTANAVLSFNEDAAALTDSTAISWIMYNSGDWSVMYSVGDTYDPDSKTDGLVATDVEVTGEGTYTVSLDFSGTAAGEASGTVFCALAIGNGETLFPGYTVDITEVLVNGEPYTLTAKPYTTSDNAICTRVNLFNSWVTQVPDDVRTPDGDTSNVQPIVVDSDAWQHMKTLSITFNYAPGN